MPEQRNPTAEIPSPPRRPFVQLLRPREWIKNLFVFGPLIFAARLHDPEAILAVSAVFLLFCPAASAVYIFNDLQDAETDRLHPRKRLSRPLASGALTPRQAWPLLALMELPLLAALAAHPFLAAILIAYQVLNVLYSLKLKHVAVVDLFCVAGGFLLRVYAGAAVLAVPLSHWMLETTLCLALFLAAVKRRQELAVSGAEARGVLARYSIPLLDFYAFLSAVCTLVFYSLFVLTVRPQLALTIPLVLFGFFRYRYLVECRGAGESPTEVLYRDAPMILTILAWGALCLLAFLLPCEWRWLLLVDFAGAGK